MIFGKSASYPTADRRRLTELWLALGRKSGDIFRVHVCKYCCILCLVFCRTGDQLDTIFIGTKWEQNRNTFWGTWRKMFCS